MDIPKIVNVVPEDNLILTVSFSNGQVNRYDCDNVIDRNEYYQMLKDPNYFKEVLIDKGGHGISWDDNVDISAFEIIENGICIEWVKEVEDRLDAANKGLVEEVSMDEVFLEIDKKKCQIKS